MNLNFLRKELSSIHIYDRMFVYKLFYPTDFEDLFHHDSKLVTCRSMTGYLY